MHRVYREMLTPKVGNLDEIHAFLIDLLSLTHQNRGEGLKLDGMHFIRNDI
jgi:hypothetical protein